jgi:type IV protein arginine methyltransferase
MMTTTSSTTNLPPPSTSSPHDVMPDKVLSMIQACLVGNIHIVNELLQENNDYAIRQDPTTGQSPLMAAASCGNIALCQQLLEYGAPWNAVDRLGQCAGNYATNEQHWSCVNVLVQWAVQAELILGTIERTMRNQSRDNVSNNSDHEDDHDSGECPSNDDVMKTTSLPPLTHEPSEKPHYLKQRVQYTVDGRALIDADSDAVMMEWERPLMRAHAQILMQHWTRTVEGENTGGTSGGRVLNIGFGMGIIDTILQEEYHPALHIIIEAHPDVYQRMLNEQWDQKNDVQVYFGKWQDVIPNLIAEKIQVDAIFYDTVSSPKWSTLG